MPEEFIRRLSDEALHEVGLIYFSMDLRGINIDFLDAQENLKSFNHKLFQPEADPPPAENIIKKLPM